MDIKVQWGFIVKNFLTLGKAAVLLTNSPCQAWNEVAAAHPPSMSISLLRLIWLLVLHCGAAHKSGWEWYDSGASPHRKWEQTQSCRITGACACSVMTLQFRNGFCSSSTLFFELRVQEFAYCVLLSVTLVTCNMSHILCFIPIDLFWSKYSITLILYLLKIIFTCNWVVLIGGHPI